MTVTRTLPVSMRMRLATCASVTPITMATEQLETARVAILSNYVSKNSKKAE